MAPTSRSRPNSDEAAESDMDAPGPSRQQKPVVRRSARLKATEKTTKQVKKTVKITKTSRKKEESGEEECDDVLDEENEDEQPAFCAATFHEWMAERQKRGGDCKPGDDEETVQYMVRMLEKDGLDGDEEEEEDQVEDGERRQPSLWERAAIEACCYLERSNKLEAERLAIQNRLENVKLAELDMETQKNAAEKRIQELNERVISGMDKEAASHQRMALAYRAKSEASARLIEVLERRVDMMKEIAEQKEIQSAHRGRVYVAERTENRRLKRDLAGIRHSLEVLASGRRTALLDRLLEIAEEDFDPEEELRSLRAAAAQAMRNRMRRSAL